MKLSIFDLFSIGVGPSSSHTVGPMRAAKAFMLHLLEQQYLEKTAKLIIDLYGSLALTGQGHGTPQAILAGLVGEEPQTVDPEQMLPRLHSVADEKNLLLLGMHHIPFELGEHLRFHQKELLPKHSNGMRFTAFDASHYPIASQVYYSIGGGFIVLEEQFGVDSATAVQEPYPFKTAAELMTHCRTQHLSIPTLMLCNEKTWHAELDIFKKLLNIAQVMEDCIHRGCEETGTLPGGLHVKRRAAELFNQLKHQRKGVLSIHESSDIMNWLNVYAMAVNEENAAGGRVVTAPTNGAAGIIPAVLTYLKDCHPHQPDESIWSPDFTPTQNRTITFLLTAGAIAILYKRGASISGAEVGCQGEVGVAASMAAGALTAALGGTLEQIENAAEIAMEHHLGMTCDPVGGLVQIPCIERNAMGAVKAVNAARLALMGDGTHKVSLDKVIATMKQTGKDMMSIYKETSLGGLAVNLIEC